MALYKYVESLILCNQIEKMGRGKGLLGIA